MFVRSYEQGEGDHMENEQGRTGVSKMARFERAYFMNEAFTYFH